MNRTHNEHSGDNTGFLAQIGVVHGGVRFGDSAPRTVRILPTTTSAFQDRGTELSTLDGLLDGVERGRSRLWSLTGPPGAGKTALAITWINQNRGRFGHAQIAMACGGDGGEGLGRGVVEVCDRYFALRGVDTSTPGFATDQGKIDMFRALVEEQEQPTVLLLDDVRTAAQVRPFLSNTPNLVVITTSRAPLKGVADFLPRTIELDPLPDTDVTALFHDVVGQRPERLETEPEALARLVALCEGNPLLAGTAAALLHDVPGLSVGGLVERMGEHGRLAHLAEAVEEGPDPAAVFEVSYTELSEGAGRLYRALGLHPVRHLDRWLAGSFFRDAPTDGDGARQELAGRNLLKWDTGAGRYLMDDLTHEHAGLAAHRHGTDAERRRTRSQTREYYLYGAVAADTVRTQRWRVGPLYGAEAPFPLPAFERPQAKERELGPWLARRRTPRDPVVHRDESATPTPDEWFEGAMDTVLHLAGQGTPGDAWQFAEATNGYFTANGRDETRADLLALGLADAEACGHTDAVSRMHAQYTERALGLGRLDQAREHARAALSAAETPGADPRGRCAALEWMGIIERRAGDAEAADRHLVASLPFLDRERERPVALHHMHRGDVALLRGDTEAALEQYRASMERFRAHAEREGRPDDANEGKLLLNQARLVEGPDQRRTLLDAALPRFLAADRAYQAGKVLEGLGALAEGAERTERWTQAAEVYELAGRNGEAARVSAQV